MEVFFYSIFKKVHIIISARAEIYICFLSQINHFNFKVNYFTASYTNSRNDIDELLLDTRRQ
jgi:hypothetical protein